MLALTGTEARVWEPKRLRLRLFSIVGRTARQCRRTWLDPSAHAPSGTSSPPTWLGSMFSNNRPDQAKHRTDQHQTHHRDVVPGVPPGRPRARRPTPEPEKRPEDDLDPSHGRPSQTARNFEVGQGEGSRPTSTQLSPGASPRSPAQDPAFAPSGHSQRAPPKSQRAHFQ